MNTPENAAKLKVGNAPRVETSHGTDRTRRLLQEQGGAHRQVDNASVRAAIEEAF